MKKLIAVVFGFFIAVIAQVGAAEPMSFQEGKDYQRAPQDIQNHPTVVDFQKEGTNKVQVLEFFSYGCTWCFKLDPFISTWSKHLPSYVTFQRVPVEFQPSWHTLAKAYYAAVDLNAMDSIHPSLFEAIQTNKVTDSSENTLRQFFVEQGIKADAFDKAYASFDVDRKQKWANAISRAYRITAVPAIIVQGPTGTYISTVRMAGSEDNLLKVVNYLIEQEHNAIAQNKQ